MAFPRTLFEFQTRFPDEASCWAYLRRVRWPRGFRCPRCEGRGGYELSRRELTQCAGCGYQASLTAGTILHGTRVPLRVWFLAIFFLGRHKQGISALPLQRDTGLGSYRTAWLLLHKVRSALGPEPGPLLTGGVEADETYVGAPHEKGRRGGRAFGRKTLVGVVVERRRARGRARLSVLRSHTFEHDLGPFVRGAIEGARTTVRTDGLATYRPLADVGVRHEFTVQGRDPERAVRRLPWSHAVFYHLKAWLRGTFRGVSPKHLPRYLDEFAYRFSHREQDGELAGLILERGFAARPLTYPRLVERGA